MKLFHISDIHIGKILHHYSLSEDQIYILNEVVREVGEKKPDVTLISGDVYDKSAPSAESMSIFNDFLTDLHHANPMMKILVISGNHDSGERLDYVSDFLESQNIYIVGLPPKTGEDYIKKVTVEDEYGEVYFYLLPFFKPSYVRGALDGEEGLSYDETLKRLIERENIDYSKRNVLLSHQFYVAGNEQPITSDSEIKNVGGLDNVDICHIKRFDYVALGHIHRSQKVGTGHVRYCGSPLKYSVSEAGHKKGICEVILKGKEEAIEIRDIPLIPKRELLVLQGTLEEFTSKNKEEIEEYRDDYVSIVLTDTHELFKPKEQLENIFNNILEIKIDNDITRKLLEDDYVEESEKSPLELFTNFFREMQGRDLSQEEKNVIEGYIDETN